MQSLFGGTGKKDEMKLNSVIKQASKIIGTELPKMEEIFRKRLIKKANSILDDNEHPSNDFLELLPSGKRFRTYRGSSRLTNSMFPVAAKVLNETKL